MSWFRKLQNSHEPWLEPLLRWQRFLAIEQYLIPGRTVVDFGCGPNALLWQYFGNRYFDRYIGVDPLCSFRQLGSQAVVQPVKIEDTRLPSAVVNTVILSAVLEHVDDPVRVLAEARRLLTENGMVIITSPTWLAKPILEFLSRSLHIISQREIDEHQRYFSAAELRQVLAAAGFRDIRVRYFEAACNLLAVAKR